MTGSPLPHGATRGQRTRRVFGALLLGIAALGFLYAWDGSRQPAAGSGWALLFSQRVLGQPNTVSLIRDRPTLEAAWDALRGPGPAPDVDFARDVVIWFVDVGSIGCRSRLDGIVIDHARRLVAGSFSRGLVAGCDDAEVVDSFLVVINRAKLPAVPWTLALREDLPPGAPGARIDVTD